MNNDPNYRATFVILNDLEVHELIKVDTEYLDEAFFENFMEFQKVFSHFFSELIEKMDSFQTKRDEIILFAIHSELYFIRYHLEAIKKFLKIIINPTKVKGDFDEKIPMSQMIGKICNKMQYAEKLKNSIKGLFLSDFEAAVTSQQYLISQDGNLTLYPNDEILRKNLNLNDLYDDSVQVRAIFDAMVNWSNGISKPTNKKNDVLDIVKGLVKQVEDLDGKLNHLS